MKHCGHTHWLGLCTHGNDTTILESDRLQRLTSHLPNPDNGQPSLFVLIGSTAKSVALREIFGVKRTRGFTLKRSAGEVHLHLDSSSVFHDRPIYLADGDFPVKSPRTVTTRVATCHETRRRGLQRDLAASFKPSLDDIADSVYTHLLFPFTDVFCFFSADLGGFRQIARHIAVWLKRGHSSNLPRSTYPRVIIVTEEVSIGAEHEIEAREGFLLLLRKETSDDPFAYIAAIDIVTLFPDSIMSADTRHRRLKERLMDASDHVRKNREDTRSLFSATHFAAFFNYACEHFSKTTKKPFDFVHASRIQNPVGSDLGEHLSDFLKHMKSVKELKDIAAPMIASSLLLDNYPPDSHFFDPVNVFKALYRDVFYQVSENRSLAFEGSTDIILRTGFINIIKNHLKTLFEEFLRGPRNSSAGIHRSSLQRFKDRWSAIQCSNTCLSCLRRRPQYGLPCGHCVCENCVRVFGERSVADPWIFKVQRCFLCGMEMRPEVVIKVHPPTAGIGILCIDGGGSRGIVPLKLMKRIEDRIQALVGLRTPLQKFCKLAFGISSGGLIVLGLYINGWSVEKCMESFEKLAHLAFKPRKVLNIPIISHLQEFAASIYTDGLYPAENIETALKEVFGINNNILDPSYATSIGAKIGVPVATIQDSSYCMFTNYNGVGSRHQTQGYHAIRPKDAYSRIPVWEIARAVSAAQGIFPVKEISGIGTFQDSGTLENNPLISALAEARVLFPLIKDPDFVISLGTGAPKIGVPNIDGSRGLWKDGALPRFCRLVWEKMRDRRAWYAFKDRSGFHRLDVEFEGAEPRLDDTSSMSQLKLNVQANHPISKTIDDIARYAIASLFYFELECVPEMHGNTHVGTGNILCILREDDPDFKDFINQLSSSSAYFCLNNNPIPGIVGDRSFLGANGNFRKHVQLNIRDGFAVSFKQADLEACNISGSPYSIDRPSEKEEMRRYWSTRIKAAQNKVKMNGIQSLCASLERWRCKLTAADGIRGGTELRTMPLSAESDKVSGVKK